MKTSLRAKANGASDFLVRYNPIIRFCVLHRLRTFQEIKAVQRVLKAAQKTRYGKGRSDVFAEWPVLEKNTVRDAPHHFVNSRAGIRIPISTGGTTGVPLKLWRSLECVVAEQVFIDGLLAPYGVTMRSRMAVLRGDYVKPPSDPEPPYGRSSHGGKRLTFSPFHLNPRTVSWYVEAIETLKPEILWLYPNTAVNLMNLLDKANLQIKVPLILSSSELMPESVHRALEQRFQCPVINYYGQAERVCFAYSTKAGEFYFDPRYGKVEFGELLPAEDGKTQLASIIGTGLWNLAMPLVRYHTGDSIHVPNHYGTREMVEVAAGKQPFIQLAGREGEYILTRDGLRITVMNQIARGVENIYQLQVIQKDFESLQIHVMPMPGFGPDDLATIERQARERIPPNMAVTIAMVDQFHTTARGKVPLVIRMLEESAK